MSLTITEKGYCQNVDGDLDTEHPGVKHDVSVTHVHVICLLCPLRLRHGRIPRVHSSCMHAPPLTIQVAELSQPRTALGMLVAALDQRRKAGRKPFTVLSCDNQPDNGHQVHDQACSRFCCCCSRCHVNRPDPTLRLLFPQPPQHTTTTTTNSWRSS